MILVTELQRHKGTEAQSCGIASRLCLSFIHAPNYIELSIAGTLQSASTFAGICVFYAKMGEENFLKLCKPLCGKEIIFLEFLEIAR